MRKPDGGTAEWHLTPGEGLKPDVARALCVPRSVTSKSVSVELAYLGSVDQTLMLFKSMRNNEKGLNNQGESLPQLPEKTNGTHRGWTCRKEVGVYCGPGYRTSHPLQEPGRPSGAPICSPRVTQAEKLSI